MAETELLLIRHGETTDNVNQILQGQTHGTLTETGRQQALQLAERLADEEIDVFMSSDLRRAEETCEIIALPHRKPVLTTPLLRERDWGGFTGMFIPDLKDRVWPDDIETIGEMKERARRFLVMLEKQYHGKRVLAVGHGIINKAIQSVYYGKPMNEIPKMANADVVVLRIIDNQ